jgi:RNA polymerase sigma-70 factor (ECF subfamily)
MGATVPELETLYRRRYGAFLRLATAVTGEEARGADAVQDGFVQALVSRSDYRGEAPLEAWVWRIVVNAARAAQRRSTAAPRAVPATVRDDAEEDADPYGVHAWITSLPEQERLVVFLRYFADLDYRGIASALGVEVGTVSATLHAAHEALRRSLEESQR